MSEYDYFTISLSSVGKQVRPVGLGLFGPLFFSLSNFIIVFEFSIMFFIKYIFGEKTRKFIVFYPFWLIFTNLIAYPIQQSDQIGDFSNSRFDQFNIPIPSNF